MHRRTRGVLAALILLAATIGLPIAIAATIGDPLHSLTSITTKQASDSAVMAILATVFYLAWASFVIPVVVEIATTLTARVTHRPRRDIRLPLLGAQQHLARTLVSAVLVIVPTATAVASPIPQHVASATTLTADTHPVASYQAHQTASGPANGQRRTGAAGQSRATTRTYVIPEEGGMRSYWALAEHYLGDGQRWREIWHLNEGRVHTDGMVMDTPRRLYAGWTILIPAAAGPTAVSNDPRHATHQVTVQPGDTLSELAADHGIRNWQEVWDKNVDRAEPGGQHLTDPNLILPGWTVTLPDMTSHRPAPVATNGHQPAHNGNSPRSGSQPHAATTPGPPPSTATSPTPIRPSPSVNRTTESMEPSTNNGQHQAPDQNPLPVPLEVGLAAAAAVVVLDRARRIAQRRRRRGHRPIPPPPALRQVEADIRRDARRSEPTAAAVHLATALTSAAPPTIHAVIARDDGAVDLLLSSSDLTPPPPFTAVPDGWRLPADATGFGYAVDSTDDPYPALVPVGRIDDGQALVDLAAAGPVSIAGDLNRVEAYLATMVAAIAGAPWADRVHIHVPPTVAQRIGPLDRVAEDAHGPDLPVHPLASNGDEVPTEPGWCTTPVSLYCGWTAADDIDELLRAAADPAHHVHVVLCGPCLDTVIWTLDGDELTIPSLLTPVAITVSDLASSGARDLVSHTSKAPDVPVGDPRLPDLTTDAPPDPSPGVQQLLLLGPVELMGSGKLRRGQILNILAYLALHRRGVDRHQLTAAIWPTNIPSRQTMRNRMTDARALVGGALSDGPLWRLDESVTTDWQQFSALAAGTLEEKREALTLVRGRPFTGLDDCDWLDLDGFRSEVEAAIVDVALAVAESDLAANDPGAALAAARAGLLASRYEERLHRIAILAAEAEGSTGKVKTLKDEMRVVLDGDIEPGDQIQPETLALYGDVQTRHRSENSDASRR